MAKSSLGTDNEVYDDSYCSKSCRKNTENLDTKISKLNEELSDCEIDLYNYKRGLSQVEARLVEFKENEVKYCERIRVLERDVEIRDNKIEYFKNELEQKDLSWIGLPEFVDDTVTDYRKTWPKDNYAHKRMTPKAVLLKPGTTPIAVSRPNMTVAQPKMISFAKTAHSNVKRPFQGKSAVRTQPRVPRVSSVTKIFPTVDSKFPTAKSTFTADLGNKGKAVKASACCIWRPKQNTTEKGLNYNGVSVTFKKYQYINTQGRLKSDSGCSRHMTGNISYLSEYEPYDGGYVLFGHGGGKITGKGILKTGKLEFENVYFVKELKYNLFNVSQICDNKNSVLFTNSECIVLEKDFKLKDDTNVLLRTPRQHNMYSIDLNNIVPHKNLTCLVAKASVDESMLWHRRLGHLNFKTMNKLVTHNLVKGLPSKCFENDHTCVACLKGKQHKASCKTKLVNYVSKPLYTLHMDLFGPTFVSSLNHKWYCLVVTNDFFRNITLIEAARTMLADAKLLVTFWAEAVNTACYVQNSVLVNKSQNKTSYELFNSITPAIGFLRPFGCHVMILNTLDHLGKFDAKGDEGYFVGYSLSSKAFRLFNKRTKKVEENLHVDFLENKLIEKGAGTKDVASQDVKKDVSSLRYIALPNWFHEAHMETRNSDAPDGCNVDVPESSGISNPTATSKVRSPNQVEHAISLTVESKIPTVSSPVPTVCLDISLENSCGPRLITKGDFSQKESPSLGNALTLSNRFEDTFGVEADLSNMEISIPEEPKKIFDALKDPSWVEAMQEELLQFKIQNVCILVDCPKGEEGIDYEEVFAPVARIEAIRLFLAYASFMGFIVEKAMYGLHQAPRAWYGTLSKEFEALMHDKFQMSVMGELTFFLGLQVLQKKDDIFLSQDKYVGNILKKFRYSDFWSTAMIETTNQETKILATVDGKPQTISESSLRRHLKLNDEEGISSLSDAELFENCSLMGYNILPNQRFTFKKANIHISETTNRVYNFSKMIFDGMPASLSRDDRHGEAFPTISSLDAEQNRENIAKTSALPHESSPRVTSLDADEGSMQQRIHELMELCTRLQRKKSRMPAKIKDQDQEIFELKARVKFLKDKESKSAEPTQEDAPITGGIVEIGEELGADKSTELGSNDTKEMVNVLSSMEAANIMTSGGAAVSVSPGDVLPTVGVPIVSGSFPTVSAIFTTASVRLSEQLARDYEIARLHAGEELKIMIEGLDKSNEVVAKHLREYEQAEANLSVGEKIDLISELMKYQDHHAKILKYQVQQSKPLSKKDQREFYMSVLKSHARWKTKHFRGMTLEQIKEKCIPVWKQLEDFVPMSLKEESERVKRQGLKIDQRSAKRVKTSKSVKHPNINWEIHSEGKREYWKIIRLGGHIAVYQFFVDMLKQLDKEDLHQLWTLVKETFSIKPATSDKEKELWVELKRLFEPDFEDQLWTHHQAFMHDPLDWKLYDRCGVHHVSTNDQEIFMLVEKDYPLRKGLVTVTICNKLHVEQYSQMASDLILMIHNIANSSR
uniref:Ribonuclease H-like domain-containing protein n=1 Tax=Tanacetum cinerariifolium TaxID=118510 RepID=A0A6L2MRK0_TANCI|nr:ribonuclease H-like domain-containing protein [Tanacetum cinerariifolium]